MRSRPIVFAVPIALCVATIGCPRRKDPSEEQASAATAPPRIGRTAGTEAGAVLAARDGGGEPESPAPPLRWGTRPPSKAELYVALDGPCEAMDVHPTLDTTIVQLAGSVFGRVTETGFDTDVSRGFGEAIAPPEHHAIGAAGGRLGDLWVEIDPGGSVLHETRVLRRKDAKWSIVAPLGTKDMSYRPAEVWRDGALLLVLPTQAPDDNPTARLVGVDLPKDVAVARLVPSDTRLYELHALENGELVLRGSRGEKNVLFLLGAREKEARPIAWPVGAERPYATLTGRSRKTFRLITEKARYQLEGERLVEEEIENAPEWRANGSTLQHLVGAGYRDVELPPLPISAAPDVRFHALHFGPDGEALVVARWTGKDDIAAERTYYALLRTRRPHQTLRCSEAWNQAEDYRENHLPAAPTGIESWPPRASETCRTPFVVLFRFSHRERVPKSFPKAEAALAKQEDLPHLDLVNVDSSGRRVVGVRTADYAQARRVDEVMKKSLRIEPEIVCADPAAIAP